MIYDASIILISTHCTGLESLNLEGSRQITDASIISLSSFCTGLQSLNLYDCHQLSDASIIPISENCTGLKELFVSKTVISDASLIAIAKNCTGLRSLFTYKCYRISFQLRHEFHSISELRAALLSIYPSPHDSPTRDPSLLLLLPSISSVEQSQSSRTYMSSSKS